MYYVLRLNKPIDDNAPMRTLKIMKTFDILLSRTKTLRKLKIRISLPFKPAVFVSPEHGIYDFRK